MKTKTIVFIHGMFMTPLCWENWIKRFEAKGYHCSAPAWPGRDKPIETQRKNHPDPELGKLKLREVVESLAAVIKSMGEKPVLIGHSMGGLIAQLLLQRDLAAAGVVIDSAPPMGVFTMSFSFLKANFPVINPFVAVTQPDIMSFERFQYAFVNALPLEEQRAAYDRYVVPESRGVPTQSLTSVAKVDFKKPHPPLLITAGEKDHIVPASLNRTNYNKYKASTSPTNFKEFTGRDHFGIGEIGWEEIADYVESWLNEKGI
jgi:pimeloyl-ACP methyl ester carboxylesterase